MIARMFACGSVVFIIVLSLGTMLTRSFLEISLYQKAAWIAVALAFMCAPFLHRAFNLITDFIPYAIYKVLGGSSDPQLFFDEHVVETVVGLADLDMYFHMNNARYQHQLDWARGRFFSDTGLNQYFARTGAYLIANSVACRYRRSLELFQRYKIKIRVVFWDVDSVYMEHRFVADSGKIKDFVYYVSVFKLRLMNRTPEQFFREFLKTEELPTPPACSEEVEHFIKYNLASSANLKKESYKNLNEKKLKL